MRDDDDLRDMFAAAAMAGMLSGARSPVDVHYLAEMAFKCAEAMMDERTDRDESDG